ncbi:hypothetical protein Ciccas_001464 [Cichlidogyrus casuarinus]|uniref:Nuclear pore membrane glycoprotein 210 n=1 Tax=Cichlidogyrus casuarinus TaxID=1844966 RepID=A0ABD2QJZ8_9PLAT
MFFLKLLFFLLFLCLAQANEFKLSDSKLLLPFSAHTQVQYTLSGSDNSCYEWISSAQDVVTVAPIASINGCSNKAVVSSVWQTDHRATATIYAKHSVTGHTVKCDVILDRIRRIEIETTTQELYLHNTPEALTVFGFDEHGNLFSTLDGIPFEWHIHGTDSLASTRSVLRFISWTESEYATPPKIGQLEAEGMQGHMQLVSGLRTGSDLVSARIKEPFYSEIPKAEVRLLVMANVQLHPPIAYLFPSATLRYKISTIQATSQLDIKLPSSQYYLEINDTGLAMFTEPSGPEIVALKYGQTSIMLIDRNVEEAINVDQSEQVKWSPSRPLSLVYVVEPAYLAFSLISFEASVKAWPNCHLAMSSPKDSTSQKLRQWIMEAGRTYAIVVELYDHNSHRIHSSENLRVSEGKLVNYEQSISGEQSILVYERVHVLPPVMVYPLLPGQSYNLTAISGSGEYTWRVAGLDSTMEADVGTISQRGEFTPVKLGENYAIAYDARSPRICNHGRLIVAKPARLGFSAGRAELFAIQPEKLKEQLSRRPTQLDYSDCNGIAGTIEVHAEHLSIYGILTVGVMVYDAQSNAFTDCRDMHISLTSQDPSKVMVLDEVLPPSNFSHLTRVKDHPPLPCLRFRVYGVSPGHTSVIAQLHSPDSDPLPSVSYPLAVYSALKMLNPPSGKSHVAVGSTKTFKWSLGPQPWFLEPSSFTSSIDLPEEHLTMVTKPARLSKATVDSSPMSCSVRCDEKGSYSLQLRLGNRQTAENIKPLLLLRHMDMVCDEPHSTRLFYKVPQLTLPPGVPPCPINTSTSDVVKNIPNTLASKMEIGYFMENGLELDAFDSIDTSVQMLDERGYAASSVLSSTNPKIFPALNQDGRRYFEIVPRELGASIGSLTAVVTWTMKRSASRLETRTNLHMISAVSIEPKDSLRLFHHPNATAQVHISHGSGYVHVSISSPSGHDYSETLKPDVVNSNSLLPVAASLTQSEPDAPLELKLQSLRQGTAVIHVLDRCFPSSALQLPVQVVGLASLHLTVPGHVQLQHKLPSTSSWEGAQASFTVLGAQLGVAQVLVRSHALRSNTVRVHVFAPPSLAPCDMNLLNGAQLELRVHGGPAQAPVDYRVPQNNHLLHLQKNSEGTRSVLVLAHERKTGTSLVEAWTGQLVAKCLVHVVALTGLRVRSALGGSRVLYAGQQVPLWAEGVALGGDGSGRVSPLGMAGAGIQFAWSVQPTEASTLSFWLEPFGTRPRPESLGAGMMLLAKRPGPVVIHLTGTTTAGQTFQASLEITVVPALSFSAPLRLQPQQVLVTPGSHFLLTPNSDM